MSKESIVNTSFGFSNDNLRAKQDEKNKKTTDEKSLLQNILDKFPDASKLENKDIPTITIN